MEEMPLKAIEYSEINDLNAISHYLARRDVKMLLEQKDDRLLVGETFDLIILLGSGSILSAELAGDLMKRHIAPHLMIVGGMGHSTQYLVKEIEAHKKYHWIHGKDKSEAEIFLEIVLSNYPELEGDVVIETQSTNCGNNATYSRGIFQKTGWKGQRILLIQDPTMQRRSHASFEKEWQSEVDFFSYAPFIPILELCDQEGSYGPRFQQESEMPWHMPRYIGLLLGEIQRLYDTDEGYGPKGLGYIEHVEVPERIIAAYNRLKNNPIIQEIAKRG